MTYCTKTEVKAHSKIAYSDLGYADDAAFDSFLDELITITKAAIDNFCQVKSGLFEAGGLELSNQLHDFTYPWIQLLHYPVLSISKVEYNNQGYGLTANWITVTEPDYIMKLDEGLLMLVNKTPATVENSIRITYTAGYSATPQIINNIAIQLCSSLLHTILQRKISPTIRHDDFTVKLITPEVFTEELQRILLPYVRKKVDVG